MLQEIAGQYRNVFRSLAQRRNYDFRLEPIDQVVAEHSILRHRAQVLVGSRNNSRVDLYFRYAPDTRDRALLHRSQYFRLRCQRQISYLIQEKRPSFGCLKVPNFRLGRAGKGPLDMAEEITLDQIRRHRRAVERLERATTSAQIVNQPGEQLLSRPSSPENTNIALPGRVLLRAPYGLGHRRGAENQTFPVSQTEMRNAALP